MQVMKVVSDIKYRTNLPHTHTTNGLFIDTMIQWIKDFKVEQQRIEDEQSKSARVSSESALQNSTVLMRQIMDGSRLIDFVACTILQ